MCRLGGRLRAVVILQESNQQGGTFEKRSVSHETRLLSLTGGGHLKEVPILRLDWEYFGVLDKWSLMGGGHS